MVNSDNYILGEIFLVLPTLPFFKLRIYVILRFSEIFLAVFKIGCNEHNKHLTISHNI